MQIHDDFKSDHNLPYYKKTTKNSWHNIIIQPRKSIAQTEDEDSYQGDSDPLKQE
jgi:hypothetical protein